ncbi:type III-B CRISPR module-associated Cmr3 family protein [Emticicia soli]|uniref:Type III-B CRISPR module-associated Cmr3 family protein n=1 Tax=Emticicia soli TaxID=2027878 RepID=A0ABW5J3L7_9BACT
MKYLVTLKPRSKFFFGGDRTFTAQERQNYYAHSTHFPQQTALLGMLRYAILNERGFLEEEEEKEKLVGATGFDLEAVSHGIIKTISPVFLLEKQAVWLSAGLDRQGDIVLKLSESKTLRLDGYDAKKGLSQYFISSDNSSESLKKLDDFFKDNPQVGNAKDRKGQTQPDAFFKHNYKSFKRQEKINYESLFAFGFELETTEEIEFSKIKTVFLGAESSFTIELTPSNGIFETIESTNQLLKAKEASNHKIVLLSDCFIPDLGVLKSYSSFILTDKPVPFKFNINKQSDYYTSINRSNQYHLLSRGTVIYPKDITEVTELIEASIAFRTIGYNHYQIQAR